MTDPMPDESVLDPFVSVEYYTANFGPETARLYGDLMAASAIIRSRCQWHVWPFVEADEVIVERPGGGKSLLLPTMHMSALTAVSETLRGVGEVAAVVDVSELDWSQSGVVEKLSGCSWTTRRRGVTATIDHGFIDAPDEIKLLCANLAGRAVTPGGISRLQVGQRSEDYRAPGIMQHELDLLAPYVRVR